MCLHVKSLQSCLAHQAPLVQARILEWIAIPFSMRSSQPRNWTWVSDTAGRFFTVWATWDSIVTGGHGLNLVGDAVGEVWHRPREKNLALGLEDLSLNPVAILLYYPELRNLCEPYFFHLGHIWNNWRIMISDSWGCFRVIMRIKGENCIHCLEHRSCSGKSSQCGYSHTCQPQLTSGKTIHPIPWSVTCVVLSLFLP